MRLERRQLIPLVLLVVLLLALPIAIFLVGKRQEIRPRALQGRARFIFSPTTTPKAGESFDLVLSVQLTAATLRISGADFMLLYDKNKLEAVNVVPEIVSTANPNAPFTHTPVILKEQEFSEEAGYRYLRVVEVANKPNDQLAGGLVRLAKITFLAKAEGQATIKFPNNSRYVELSGLDWTALPTVTPTRPPAQPTVTPTLGAGVPTPTRTPTPATAAPTATRTPTPPAAATPTTACTPTPTTTIGPASPTPTAIPTEDPCSARYRKVCAGNKCIRDTVLCHTNPYEECPRVTNCADQCEKDTDCPLH